jgi:hypothetical protein
LAQRSRLGSRLAPAVLLALTGCVAQAEAPSPTDPHGFMTTTTMATSTSTRAVEPSLTEFRECMSDRGAPVPEVALDGLGRPRIGVVLDDLDLSSGEVLEALEECGGVLTTGALSLESDPEMRRMVQAQLEEFSRCVRAEGVAGFPDPVARFDGVGSPYPGSRIPWTHPGLADAVTACRNVPFGP